jgi:hypothetical protein
MGDSQERSRLAELLYGRGHPAEALVEMEKIPESLFSDPSLRYRKARILETKGDLAAAEAVIHDPKQWIASFGPCWAVRARLLQTSESTQAHEEALAHDPLTTEAACGGEDQGKPLCDAAKKREEPDLGQD